MSERTVVQIALAMTPQDGEGMYSERLYALCDDGTIWRRYFDRHRGVSTWQRIPSPLDEDEL